MVTVPFLLLIATPSSGFCNFYDSFFSYNESLITVFLQLISNKGEGECLTQLMNELIDWSLQEFTGLRKRIYYRLHYNITVQSRPQSPLFFWSAPRTQTLAATSNLCAVVVKVHFCNRSQPLLFQISERVDKPNVRDLQTSCLESGQSPCSWC